MTEEELKQGIINAQLNTIEALRKSVIEIGNQLNFLKDTMTKFMESQIKVNNYHGERLDNHRESLDTIIGLIK